MAWKSVFLRSRTTRPRLSRIATDTVTRSTPDLKVATGPPGAGVRGDVACAETPAGVIARVVMATNSATGSRITAFVLINALATSVSSKTRTIIRNSRAAVLMNQVMSVILTLGDYLTQVRA